MLVATYLVSVISFLKNQPGNHV